MNIFHALRASFFLKICLKFRVIDIIPIFLSLRLLKTLTKKCIAFSPQVFHTAKYNIFHYVFDCSTLRNLYKILSKIYLTLINFKTCGNIFFTIEVFTKKNKKLYEADQ